jgi:hypothetical protein
MSEGTFENQMAMRDRPTSAQIRLVRAVEFVVWTLAGFVAIYAMTVTVRWSPEGKIADRVYPVVLLFSLFAPGAAFGGAVGALVGKRRLAFVAAGILAWVAFGLAIPAFQ